MSGIPRRPFGRDGEEICSIGLGGGHIGRVGLESSEGVRIMHRAIDEGLDFFDNAWEYNERESERRMGEAIHDRRDKVFVMTKVCSREKQAALTQLDESLRSLRTDHLDLWMFHEVNYADDPDLIFAPGGAAEAGLEALASGKVRHIGFTGHKDPSFHIRMLEEDYPWSALLMPVNVLDPSFHRSFVREVLPLARKKSVSVLGMKSVGGLGQFITEGGMDAQDCLRYALSQDISSLVTGIDSMQVLEQNMAVAREDRRLDGPEQEALIEKYAALAGAGHLERFKTTQFFDSRYHREQHGFPEVTTIN